MPADTLITSYPFDPSGKKISNKITGEQQVLTSANFRDYHFIVPKLGPFFGESLVVSFKSLTNEIRILTPGVDYLCTHWFLAASKACAVPLYGSISFLDLQLVGTVTLSYQTIGGIWVQNEAKIAEILADRLHNPRITSWDSVVDMPVSFPVIDHEWELQDLVGMSQVNATLNAIASAISSNQIDGFAAHVNAKNPHGLTAVDLDTLTATQIDQRIATKITEAGVGGGEGTGPENDALAMAALNSHVAAGDPHPQYMTQSETTVLVNNAIAASNTGGTSTTTVPDDELYFN